MAGDLNGKGRLALITFIVTVGTMLITYAVTVTLVYARLDKENATQSLQIDYLTRRVDALEISRDALWRQKEELRRDVDYLNRALEPEIPRRNRVADDQR
jgi:hypothetical protein